MSEHGNSERIRFLRDTIAGIEQAGGGLAPALQARIAFGEPCSFDRALGGLLTGALYEVAPLRMADGAAASGFALALAALFLRARPSALIWIADEFSAREYGAPYGPGVAAHGLDPARIVLVRCAEAQDVLWATEEALRAGAPAAVLADLGGAARLFDLVAARRLALAARGGGCSVILLHPPGAFQRALAQNGARMRFEIMARRSVPPAVAGVRPTPGAAHFGVRFAKPGVMAGRVSGLDTDAIRTIIWEHEHGIFRDALSLVAPAAAGAGERRAANS